MWLKIISTVLNKNSTSTDYKYINIFVTESNLRAVVLLPGWSSQWRDNKHDLEKGQVSRARGTTRAGRISGCVEEVAALETPKKWGHSEERGVPLVRLNEVPDSNVTRGDRRVSTCKTCAGGPKPYFRKRN